MLELFRVVVFTICLLESSALLTPLENKAHCHIHNSPAHGYKKACCEYKNYIFAERWQSGGTFLTTHLHTLRAWNCSSYYEECNNPTYHFNRFTKLVYKLFCHPEQFRKECGELSANNSGKEHPSLQDLSDPCIAVSLYRKYGQGRYFEVVQPRVPFCNIVWSGMSAESAERLQISPWNMLSSRCQLSIIIGMTVMLILALLIVVANLTIILIFIKRKKLRNCQLYYRLSIAVADLFVGAIVLPSSVASEYKSVIGHRTLGRPYNSEASNFTNQNGTLGLGYESPFLNDSNVLRYDGGGHDSIYTQSFINFVGFFTAMSLFVSLYSLMFATFDRFYAIFQPLRYRNGNAVKRAKISCCALWGFGFIICTLPFYNTTLKYGLGVGGLAIAVGTKSLILLSATFVTPLVLVWILTVFTLMASHRYAKVRHKLSGNHGIHRASLEAQLARTLALMVGVFSACVISIILILIIPLFLDNLHYTKPDIVDLHKVQLFIGFQYCSVIVLFSNSLWNFFIYSARDKKFRVATKEEMKLLFCKLHLITSIQESTRSINSSRINQHVNSHQTKE